MKKNIFKSITVILITFMLFSCVEDSFDVPVPTGNEQNKELSIILGKIATDDTWNLVSIADLKSRFTSGDAPLLIDKNDVVKGYVVSSDRTGNFFQEIYIQDAPENPTAGIKVALSLRNSYTKFNIGREVYIQLNGLYLGETNSGDGITTIGGKVKADDADEVDEITENQINVFNHILRSDKTEVIVPTAIKASQINGNLIGTFVRIEEAFFPEDLKDQTIVDPKEDFDTQRTLAACGNLGEDKFILETSSFANFSSVKIQTEKGGTIDAVVTKDFRGDNFVVVINDYSDINFDKDVDCAIDALACTGATSTTREIFNEDFQSITNESQLDGLGWTNINISGGSERYERSSFSGDTYLKISAFGTGEAPLEAWLVSPAINLDSSTEEELTFEVSANFETGKILSAFITENYTGDPTTTEWTQLNADIPVGGSSFGSFVKSTINISCLNGDVHVAFRYIGNAGADETRYHIDDIKVTGK
ncbi:DUF5689 domain-containing protein [Tenacibaculum agarivorans]|uniref:DUF5689 domain-containing protein n=1 Tax=Tenacibaculum agarivorans TaxID=1908389 RepID=UPI00094B93BD|nr:DUF5689 domain-containing protein [Tenacibaculum agarivorans]